MGWGTLSPSTISYQSFEDLQFICYDISTSTENLAFPTSVNHKAQWGFRSRLLAKLSNVFIEVNGTTITYVLYANYRNYLKNEDTVQHQSGYTDTISTYTIWEAEGDNMIYRYTSTDGHNWTLDSIGSVWKNGDEARGFENYLPLPYIVIPGRRLVATPNAYPTSEWS